MTYPQKLPVTPCASQDLPRRRRKRRGGVFDAGFDPEKLQLVRFTQGMGMGMGVAGTIVKSYEMDHSPIPYVKQQ